jgi:uncharacterized protein YdhG (YjbR/CyaY superfamily)
MAKTQTVDRYLAGLAAEKRAALEQVRRHILAAAPRAEECFSYGLPAFRQDGVLVAGLGASAKHCAYYPMSGAVVAALGNALDAYQTSKGAIRFDPARPLPAQLVKKLVKARLAEGSGTRAAKKASPKLGAQKASPKRAAKNPMTKA